MADCMARLSPFDFFSEWSVSYDESSFTDDEGTSLLDDLAEAKRHVDADDLDRGADAECILLWEDAVFDGLWTDKNSSGGPTLAELNGGELSDFAQHEPQRVFRKRKMSKSGAANCSCHSTTRVRPLPVCLEDTIARTSTQVGSPVDGCTNAAIRNAPDSQRTASDSEVQSLPLSSDASKPARKVRRVSPVIHDKHLKAALLVPRNLQDMCSISAYENGHPVPVSGSKPAHEATASKSSADLAAKKNLNDTCQDEVMAQAEPVVETDKELGDAENYADSSFAGDDGPRCRSPFGYSSGGGTDPQRKYFWQYNTQSKGPKCQTSQMLADGSDPDLLDPVTADQRSRVSGKQFRRRKDASDVDTDANPRRLLLIGNELQRLSSIINASPGANAYLSLSAREKNRFASRICRLKRKAQHEANKIKLQGLEHEHRMLTTVLNEIKTHLVQRVRGQRSTGERSALSSTLQSLMKAHLSEMIAEHTDEYVSCMLERLHQTV